MRALAAVLALALSTTLIATTANAITLTPIATGFNTPVGIDHHAPTNKVVMSVHYPTGQPYNFELVAADGSRQQFSSISGFTDEVKIATARTTANGFIAGELFTGTGVSGVIARISANGASVINPWVTLPGESGLMRGGLYIDRTGVWGGDLIVVTTAGGVWRVTAAGAATKVAQITTHLEGLVTVPNDAAQYGPWAGKILIGAEQQTRIYSVDTNGTVVFYNLNIQPEDIEIIPANENFFGVDYGAARLVGAPPSEFAGMVGDILIAQEFPGILWRVHWNGSSFQTTQLAQVTQWEHVTFSSAGVPCLPPVCTIDGETRICEGQITLLCGPQAAGASYVWDGPGGFHSVDQCITTGTPGQYILTLTVPCTGSNPVSSACTTFVQVNSLPPCSIAGPSVICQGQTIEVCGPQGNFLYQWSTGDLTRCITVGTAGTYILTVTDLATGCMSRCAHTVDAVTRIVACPRTAGFWTQQCDPKDNGSTKYSAGEVQTIAECVDERSSFFGWPPGTDAERFCAIVNPPSPMDPRKQAKRQFATLLANVCAGELHLQTLNGEFVALSPCTPISCSGFTATNVGQLIAEVDALLANLESRPLAAIEVGEEGEGELEDFNAGLGDPVKPGGDPAVRAAYNRIIACLDAINNGIGIAVNCASPQEGGDDDGDDDPDSRGLGIRGNTRPAGELHEIALYRPAPNPFSGVTRIAYSLDGVGAPVDIGIYDIAGRMVRKLVNDFQSAGPHETSWDGRNSDGVPMQAGMYFVRARLGSRTFGTQLLLVH